MSLTLTRKTYYLLGILAVACNMFNAILLLTGSTPLSLGENIAFVLTGLMLLFLAALRNISGSEKARCFLSFVLLLAGPASLTTYAPINRALLGGCWVNFVWMEYSRLRREDPAKAGPFSGAVAAVCLCELAQTLLLLAPEMTGLIKMAYNLMFFACTLARGWALVALYRQAASRQ